MYMLRVNFNRTEIILVRGGGRPKKIVLLNITGQNSNNGLYKPSTLCNIHIPYLSFPYYKSVLFIYLSIYIFIYLYLFIYLFTQ